MVITWYGGACFKIQSGDLIIVTDPFSKETGLIPPRFRADIVTLSHAHSHLQSESIPEHPIIIDGPGEYEVRGVMIRGIEAFHDNSNGALQGYSTVYRIEAEDMKLAHLGFLGEEKLRGETLEAIGDVDILFVPVGGGETIDAEAAQKIVQEIEPRIVIPMCYKISGMKGPQHGVDVFLKEMGVRNKTEEERLTLKKKDLPQTEETNVVVLKTV